MKAEDFPIAPVLEYLGFEDVPHVTSGHRKVRCHFHGERNPSASVSRYGYTCFACGVTGDAIRLLREQEGLSHADAVRLCQNLTNGGDQPLPREPARSGWW